jgi:hypothetical protein
MSILPENELVYLTEKGFSFEEHSEGGQCGIVLKNYPLPIDKYDQNNTDVLILLPQGFPDTPPDMFYLFPWLRLKSNNSYPKAADVTHPFKGISWQRWSRHSNEWRAGKDGLASYIKRVQNAIETAT